MHGPTFMVTPRLRGSQYQHCPADERPVARPSKRHWAQLEAELASCCTFSCVADVRVLGPIGGN